MIIGGKRCVINGYTAHYSGAIAYDLDNPGGDEVDDEFGYKGSMEKALSRTVKTGSSYYGTSITRKSGLQIRRDEPDGNRANNGSMKQTSLT